MTGNNFHISPKGTESIHKRSDVFIRNISKNNKRKCSLTSSFLLLILCIFVLGGCSKKVVVVPTLLDPVVVKLDTETVKRDSIYDIDLVEGSIVPYTEGVYFNEDSQISKLLVGMGDTVKKGQALISLDLTAVQEEFDTLSEDINFTENNNSYSNEQADYDMEIVMLQLKAIEETGTAADIAQKNIDIIELEEQQSYAKTIQELDLEQKKERLAKLQEQLNRSDLTAPFDGTVVYCENLNDGSTVQAFNPVIYLADDSRLTLQTAYIPTDTLTTSHEYYALIGDKKYNITNMPYSKEDLKYKVYNKLTLNSNFSVEGADSTLVSGMYAAICLVRNYTEDVLVIPKKALYRDAAVRYVYKIVDGERVRQEVKVGSSTRIMMEITEGLSEGDEVYVQQ